MILVYTLFLWETVLFDPYIGTYQVLPLNIRPEIEGNEGVLRVPQICSVTGALASDYLASYLGRSFV